MGNWGDVPGSKIQNPKSEIPRLVSLDSGIIMVVTDLHGDGALYERYRDLFLVLRARGLADTLVFTGDLLHHTGPEDADRSLDIVLDLMALQETLPGAVIVLLGNHELPHLYHVPLSKGDYAFTPRFEAALGAHRERVSAWLEGLPFYLRTRAGVALCHAGAFPEAADADALTQLLFWSHRALLAEVEARLPAETRPALREELGRMLGVPYPAIARAYLAVTEPADPRYDDYLIGQVIASDPRFELLWSAFFTRNEREHEARAYGAMLTALLARLSQGYIPQRVLVTGHLTCRNGYLVLADNRQLRLASGIHAEPYAACRYLLFDAGRPVERAGDLLRGLGRVFEGAM